MENNIKDIGNRLKDVECEIEEVTKPEFDYEMKMKDLMGLDIERDFINREFDEYKKSVEEHGYYSKEVLTRRLFIDLRKIGTAQYV